MISCKRVCLFALNLKIVDIEKTSNIRRGDIRNNDVQSFEEKTPEKGMGNYHCRQTG